MVCISGLDRWDQFGMPLMETKYDILVPLLRVFDTLVETFLFLSLLQFLITSKPY